MSTRKPAAAGRFYPSNKSDLIKLLDKLIDAEKERIKLFPENCELVGAIVPHAGYIYSGYEAVHFFQPLSYWKQKFDTIVILNPDHHGVGNEASVDDNVEWETPLGKVNIDSKFASVLNLSFDKNTQQFEHSAEVMVPFLQYFLPYPFQIVPIAITLQKPEVAVKLSKSIFKAVKETKRKILIIASSDFSHYLPAGIGAAQDDLVLKEILAFKSEGVFKIIRDNDISVCGYGPIMTLIEYSKLLNRKVKADVLIRGHSDKSGISNSVVDYNTVLFYYE